MLELKDVCLNLGGRKLADKLSTGVNAGETLGIIGPAGSGKTALLRAIMGLQPVESGYISVDGELVTAGSAGYFRQMMAYVPQNLALPYDKVAEMVNDLIGLETNRTSGYTQALLLREWEHLGIDKAVLEASFTEVGEAQLRLILLTVLQLLGKQIFLVDTPAAGYDLEITLDYLRGIARRGCAVVIMARDDRYAEYFDNRINLLTEE